MSPASDQSTSRGARLAPLVHADLAARRDELLDDLRHLVELETPSDDPHLLLIGAEWLAEWLSELGSVKLVRTAPGIPPHVLVEFAHPGNRNAPLVLCHYDTVWPAGTREQWSFAVDSREASGPGILDMKASIVLVRHALSVLAERRVAVPHGLRLLVTCDEEVANPTSAELIRDLAQRSSCALVMEPPLPDGRLKTVRKGYARVRIGVEGRAAHAGIEPGAGVNAAVEAAHITAHAHALGLRFPNTSVTVGFLRAGDRTNVVPSHGQVGIDVRSTSPQVLQEIIDELRALQPTLAGASIAVDVEARRPPMLRTPGTGRLFRRARHVAASLGIDLREGSTGGVSEGNLTQAAGIPTLDGLGVVGIGPHTPGERIQISSLLIRSALFAGLLTDLAGSLIDAPNVGVHLD